MSVNKKKVKKIVEASAAVLGVAFVGMRIFAKRKKPDAVYDNEPNQKNPMAGKRVVFVKDENDKENADGVKGHLEAVGEVKYHPGIYEKYIKKAMDVVLSFGGLIVLSPVFLGFAIAIYIDDPGPVLFTQKRVGQNKEYFKLHKFRSMKMSTPHDVPTHMLENPEQYITRVGRFMRAHSIDELPQIWDIFVGTLTLVGPRPGLWNQDLLVAERDKYGANDVKPGLTGWAQINGRDELEIEDKARLDGEYVRKMSFLMDLKCFLGSVSVFAHDDSVVEGGTGEMKKKSQDGSLVSIITPAYNSIQFLEEMILSVQNQTYKNWELIIVDDCSVDGTYSLASEYSEKDSRIKVLHNKENCGVAESRNNALDIAQGDYIAFLDSDDMWVDTKLEKQIAFMKEKNCALSYSSYCLYNSESNTIGKVINVPKKMNAEDIYGNTAIACLTVVVNRKMTGSFHMPLLNHAEDQCTWQELLKRGYTAYGMQDMLAYYRVGNKSLSFDKKSAAKQQWNIYREYYGFAIIKSLYYFSKYAFNAVRKNI